MSRMYTERKRRGGVWLRLVEIDNIYKREIVGMGQYLEDTNNRFLLLVYHHENSKPPSTSLINTKVDYVNMLNIRIEHDQRWEEKTPKEKVRALNPKEKWNTLINGRDKK